MFEIRLALPESATPAKLDFHYLFITCVSAFHRKFSRQQYFDSEGVFITVMLSTPILFNCILLLVGADQVKKGRPVKAYCSNRFLLVFPPWVSACGSFKLRICWSKSSRRSFLIAAKRQLRPPLPLAPPRHPPGRRMIEGDGN